LHGVARLRKVQNFPEFLHKDRFLCDALRLVAAADCIAFCIAFFSRFGYLCRSPRHRKFMPMLLVYLPLE
jgi:hypothetical protein